MSDGVEDMIVRRPRPGAICVGLALLASPLASAAEPKWPSAPYGYVVVDQDLRTVLTQFGANTGLRIALSDAVQGQVRGRLPSVPPREFLDTLAQSFGLDWYFDGAVISVSAASEAQARLLSLQGVGFAKLRKGLASAGLIDPRFQLRPGASPDIALVSGPPRYVALVQQAVTALSSEKEVKGNSPSVVIIRGATASRVEFP